MLRVALGRYARAGCGFEERTTLRTLERIADPGFEKASIARKIGARAVGLASALLCILLGSIDARAESAGVDTPEPASKEFVGADGLTGREIYQRFLDKRGRESFQKLRIISRDPGGSEQLSRFELLLQDARDEHGEPTNGVRWRTRIDVNDPPGIRHTKYLIITKQPGPNDEFVYQPSARRVRRVELGETSFLGTDFTFDDFGVQYIEDADYRRHPDAEIEDRPVYVVETTPRESSGSEYAKTMVYLEKERLVPLRVRSWDELGVAVKEATAPESKIQAFGETWVATESTVRDLRQNTSSTLFVDELDTQPNFKRGAFTTGRLARGK